MARIETVTKELDPLKESGFDIIRIALCTGKAIEPTREKMANLYYT
jgi:hypothetical protein